MARGLSARRWLLLYLSAVLGLSFVHQPVLLAGALLLAVLGAGRAAWGILRRALVAVLTFNLTVSLGYCIVSYWQGGFQAEYLLLVNLRVLLLVFLGFWLVSRIDLLAMFDGYPVLQLIVTLAVSQIKTFERILRDFRLAFQSRNPAPPRLVDQTRHAAAQAATLLDKSLVSAAESAQALRSRGAFDD